MKCKKPPWRLWIGVMIFFSTYIGYAFRVNMSVSILAMVKQSKNQTVAECTKEREGNSTADPKPLPDYGPRYDWSPTIGLRIVAAYYVGDIVGSFVAGQCVVWFGPTYLLFFSQLIACVLNSCIVWSASLHYDVVCAIRFLIGLLGAMVYPPLHRIIATWALPSEKGKFISALLGNVVGTCVTWPLVGFVTEHLGWAWGIHVVSIKGLIYCVVLWFLVTDRPETHRWISEEEKKLITDSHGTSVSKKRHTPPYKKIFTSVPFYAVLFCHFGNVWCLYLQSTTTPKFIEEILGMDLEESGFLSALPFLSRFILGMGFGALGDYLTKKGTWSVTKIRKVFIIFSHFIPSILLMCVGCVGCNWMAAVSLLTLAQGINGAAVLTNLHNPQDLSPNYAGVLFGIMTSVGATTGFITTEITSALTKYENTTKQWAWIFIIAGTVYALGGIIFILFGSGKLQPWNDAGEESAPESAST